MKCSKPQHIESQIQNRAHCRGYVLVMTLILLAIVSMSAAALARRSASITMDAIQSERSLQRKWAAQSALHLTKNHETPIMEWAQSKSETPISSWQISFELNRMPMVLLISDEQAKPNITTLLQRYGMQKTQRLVTPVNRINTANTRLQLRPLYPAVIDEGPLIFSDRDWPLIASYRDLYSTPSLIDLVVSDKTEALYNAQIGLPPLTCWGDGKLRFQNASAQSLIALLQDISGQRDVMRLIQIRTQQPSIAVADAIAQLDISAEQEQVYLERLIDVSTCFATLVLIQDQSRIAMDLEVRHTTSPQDIDTYRYTQKSP